MMKTRAIASFVALLLMSPTAVRAAGLTIKKSSIGGNIGAVAVLIGRITDFLLTLVGGLAIIFILIGGIQYITSAGNPQKADTAKKTLTYAVLGVIVVLLSKIALPFIFSIFK